LKNQGNFDALLMLLGGKKFKEVGKFMIFETNLMSLSNYLISSPKKIPERKLLPGWTYLKTVRYTL
jgi:hypothetical protein